MPCCERLSKGYIITVNFFIACFGCALVTFGVMGSQEKFDGAVLFPVNILKMINILGVLILFAAVIGSIGAFYRESKTIHILYFVIIVIAFIFQVITGIIVYQLATSTKSWLNVTWEESPKEYREYAQNKFSCCGYANSLDHPAATSHCSLTDSKSMYPACFDPLVHFISHELATVYIVLFSALCVEILATCNGITLLCARIIYPSDSISLHELKKGSSTTLVDSAIERSVDTSATKYYHSHPHPHPQHYRNEYAK